jgi:hypothetical protein
VYVTPDSGGECGVAYESYFPMPAAGKDKPWYSIEQGSVHFLVMSTEHPWSEKSEQVCVNQPLRVSIVSYTLQIFTHSYADVFPEYLVVE